MQKEGIPKTVKKEAFIGKKIDVQPTGSCHHGRTTRSLLVALIGRITRLSTTTMHLPFGLG
jgi:hypothetical protein